MLKRILNRDHGGESSAGSEDESSDEIGFRKPAETTLVQLLCFGHQRFTFVVLLWVDGCALFDISNAVYPPTVRNDTIATIGAYVVPEGSGDVHLSTVMFFQGAGNRCPAPVPGSPSPVIISRDSIQVFLEACVDGLVVMDGVVQSSSTAVLKNVNILKHILLDWKIWQNAPLHVWEMCCEFMEIMVRPSHPNSAYNIQQMVTGKIPRDMLNYAQIYEITHKGEQLPSPIISSVLTILYYLLGHPPDLGMLKQISDYLTTSHNRRNVTVGGVSVRRSFFAPNRNSHASYGELETLFSHKHRNIGDGLRPV
eukprot:sb/3467111/